MKGYGAVGNMPCTICHENSYNIQLNKMNYLLNLLKEIGAKKVAVKDHYNYDFNVSIHCRFGLHCPDNQIVRSKCDYLIKEIEPRLNDYKTVKKYKVHILNLLQGSFPREYNAFARNCQ